MTTEIVYHEVFTKHEISPGHPESPQRLKVALDCIRKAGLLQTGKVKLVTPKPADLNEVYALHDREYVEDIHLKCEQGGGFFTQDTAVNSYTYDAMLLASGGGIMAVDSILEKTSDNGFVLCRPPGHHAEHDRALGFCFVNNIAIAAQHLVKKRHLDRVMIVDYDGHHGNGTQHAFYDTNKVLYVSLHQDGRTLFPGSGFPDEVGNGEGKGYTVNLSMYPGAGDRSYDIAFTRIVEPLAEAYKPQFVLVSLGFDCHFEDPLTSLGLTTSGISMVNARVHKIAKEYAQGRLAVFLEGGYNLNVVGTGCQNLIEELSDQAVTKAGDSHQESDICIRYTEELVKVLENNLEGILS
jgi:acetoin utilization deacetylase AcuC-like enzyme